MLSGSSAANTGNPSAVLKYEDGTAKYNPTNQESSLLADLLGFVMEAEQSKERPARVWELVDSYFRGNQNLYQDPVSRQLVIAPEANNKLISTNNQMVLALQQLHAKLTKHIPEFTVDPSNGDQDQIQAAMAGTEFIKFFRAKEDFEIRYAMAMYDTAKSGVGHLMQEWDPDGGRRMLKCDRCAFIEEDIEELEEPCPSCAMEAEDAQMEYQASVEIAQETMLLGGQPMPIGPPPQVAIGTLQEFREGDVTIEYLNPREFLPEPGCTEMWNMRKWAIRRIQPVSKLRERYPEFADVIERKSGLHNLSTPKIVRSSRSGGYTFTDFKEHAVETIYYECASALYPKGRRIVTINDEILVSYEEENPLWFLNRPNVYTFPWNKPNDMFYPQPFGEHAWHRQRELNENESQQRSAAEHLANAKVFIPYNSGVSPDELTAKAGQAVMYNPGLPIPKVQPLGQMAPEIPMRGGILKSSVFEQATIGLAEQGLQSGAASGRSLAIIQAESDQQIGPTLKRCWSELADLFKGALQIARRNYGKDRQYRVVGDMGLQVWTLAEMELDQGYDIRITPEDGLSTNQQLRLQSMLDLVNIGLYHNAMGVLDKQAFVKDAKLKLGRIGGDTAMAQRTRAHYILRKIEKGDFTIQPFPWDDPLAHAEVFKDWLQTKGYNPKTDQAVSGHVYKMFQFYMQMAMFQANPGGGMAPPQSPAEQPGQTSRMSGDSQGAGQMPGVARGQSVGQAAAGTIQNADRQAENMARSRAQPHEG